MATYNGNAVVVSGSSTARLRIEWQLAGQEVGNNRSLINWQCYIFFDNCDAQLDNGFVGWNGGALYDNPGRVYNYAGNFADHTVTMGTGSFWVNHDANGNASFSMNADVAVFQSGTSAASGSSGLPRIPLAPSISALQADTIKPTTARLRAELSSHGHGTSTTLTMFYKLTTEGSYTSAGAQADISGFNNWNLTGLKPGKAYHYFVRATNNNGDTVDSGVQQFTTQPVSGMLSVMRGVM